MIRKILIGLLILIAVLAAVGFIFGDKIMENMLAQTKKASPEQVVTYSNNGYDLEVFYNRPSKKGRVIFAEEGLVPYGEIWRTGANEATTFETKKDLNIDGQTLAAGKYTLWTVPGDGEWEVIFNSGTYAWGVSWPGKASIDREKDALVVKAKTEATASTVEMFTIAFEEGEALNLALSWDNIKVRVPIN